MRIAPRWVQLSRTGGFNRYVVMANDPLYNHLREINWRRKLSAAEARQMRQWLEGHPEAHADWEAELALGEGLGRLPDAPVPSNFTARVLQAVGREQAVEGR